MNPNTPIIINTPSAQKQDGAIDYVFKGALIVGGLWLGKKAWDKYRADKASDKAGGDPNTQAATEIHQAIDGAGTSEKVLYAIANKNINWAEVSKAYRKLYNSNMLEDIKGDLDNTEYAKFLNIYNLSQNGGTGGKNTVTQGFWVYVEKSANVRKTPKIPTTIEEIKSLGKTNIIGLAASGKYLGVATGRTAVDTATKEGTLFIEVKIGVVASNNKSEIVNAWVASSQVRTEAPKQGFNPGANITTFTREKYNAALGSIGAESNYQAELHTKEAHTAIYDSNGKLINYADSKGLILGFKEAETTRNNTRFYVFKNIQGIIRTVPVEAVKEVRV